MIGDLVRAPSIAALQKNAAELFASAAVDAVKARGIFRVALAGGKTPEGVYALLTGDHVLRSQIPWRHVHFYFGDERHVGPDHPDSNFRMAQEAMFTHLPEEPGAVWRIRGEYSRAEDAAREYERDLRELAASGPGQWPRFDLVFLGMGPDGHTASLFPHTTALYERDRLVVSNRVDKLNTDRITMTVPVLNNAKQIVFLIQGAEKADALRAVLEGSYEPDQLPTQLIHPSRGRLIWLVDPSAARLLSKLESAELQS